MSGSVVQMQWPNPVAFEPFGQLVLPPDKQGMRRFYSDALQDHSPASAAVLHVNHVAASSLPLEVNGIERHPFAAQCFFPIDVSRYAVLVFPSDEEGRPVREKGLAFLMPGSIGVIYNPNVWHLGATVFDRPGHFAVLMWRGGPQQDDEFRTLPPLTLLEPS